MFKTRIDLTGQKFNRLTVIEYAGTAKDGHAKWRCKCDCGNETIVTGNSLKSGNSKSCGCYNIESSTHRIVSLNTTHGKTDTRLYRIWQGMKTRCGNPNAPNYTDYGNRGITVCDEWMNSFKAFSEWANNNGYSDDLTIDRIDNNKGYSPENCRWTTAKGQNRNRRTTKRVTHLGETHSLVEWAEKTGISYDALLKRIKNGWSFEKAITTPVRARIRA